MDRENDCPNEGLRAKDETEGYEGDTIPTSGEATEAFVRHESIESTYDERLYRAVEQGLADIKAGRVSDDLERLFSRVG